MIKNLEYDKLTIYEVEDLHKEILAIINNVEDELILDFSRIQKLDMTSIQLLIATKESCKKKSIPFSTINLSTALKETLISCGCDTVLEVN